jgi:hypothetical protein
LGGLTLLLHRTRFDVEWHRAEKRAARVVLLIVCLGALFAMPFMSMVTGTGIELYHFNDSYVRVLSIAVVVMGLHVAEALLETARTRVAKWRPDGRLARHFERLTSAAVLAVALLAGGYFAIRFAFENPRTAGHMRADIPEWGRVPAYRAGFVELARELSRPAYDDRLVLGTFDTQLWSWWVTFRGGYSFLADACTSNARDAELERRTAALAKAIGMTSADFVTFVRRPYVNIFWIGCAKFQASKAFTYAPLDAYDDADRAGIDTTTYFSTFAVALPRSEQARLVQIFDSIDVSRIDRLDLIALTKDESTIGFAPSPAEFDQVFENAVFRVWARRGVTPPPTR